MIMSVHDVRAGVGTRRASSSRLSTASGRSGDVRKGIDEGLYNYPNLNRVTAGTGFAKCAYDACQVVSSVADFSSMTLRIGFEHCYNHTSQAEVSLRASLSHQIMDPLKTTVVFYDIEVSRDGQIEQLSAFAESGERFSTYMRTSVRTNTSPILRSLPPWVYSAMATEPKEAMTSFIAWTKKIHSMNTNGNSDMSNIILAAHFGSCHDHVYLIRTMMMWGVDPPCYRMSDTLALFKLTISRTSKATLSVLATRHAAWMAHVPHDADSDAKVLRAVVMTTFPMTKQACFAFSTNFANFMLKTGLNMYKTTPTIEFPKEIDFTNLDATSSGSRCVIV